VTLPPAGGLVLSADRLVVVEPTSTVSVWAELVEFPWPDPLAAVNAAVSDSGEPEAANDVEHVAAPDGPLATTGWLAQPEMVVPLAENATVPDGVAELVDTVAVSMTAWLVLAGDGFGVARVVVVVAVTGWTFTVVAEDDEPVKLASPP
jgi:hypothetical protein